MYMVSYRRTMANAKVSPAAIREASITELEESRRRAAAELAEIARKRAEEEARLDEVRKHNAKAVADANAALAKLHEEWAKEDAKRKEFAGSMHVVSMDAIMRRICRAFGINVRDLRSNRRHKRVCLARHAVCYWAARRTNLSLPQIGRLLGGRDHTTILHGKRAYVEKRAAMGRTLRPVR